MDIIITKDSSENIIVKLKINGVEQEFDYIKLIDNLYNQMEINNVFYDEMINEWEKEEIGKLIEKIKQISKIKEDESADTN